MQGRRFSRDIRESASHAAKLGMDPLAIEAVNVQQVLFLVIPIWSKIYCSSLHCCRDKMVFSPCHTVSRIKLALKGGACLL